MNILIYGATEIGHAVALRLYKEHNVTLLDEQEQLPEKFDKLDISFLSGSGADVAILEQARGDKLDLFISCSKLDEANIVACWTIKKIGDIETICFVSSMELYHNLTSAVQYRTNYDIDTVIWPETLLMQDIFRIISVPDAIDVEYFAKGRVKLFEYRIKANSNLINTRIMDCSFPPDVLVIGISRDQELFIPDGSTVILYDDKVIFVGTGTALDQLAAQAFHTNHAIKTAVVVGGGNVGFLLAGKLEQIGIKVKLIEHNENRCNFLADQLKKCLVLHGDGTDLELLEEEQIGQSDVAVIVTNNDEKNLLCSLLIKQLGAERIITRVDNPTNIQLFERVGIDAAMSPLESALTELLNRVQAHQVDILALVEGGQGEVLRLILPDGFAETRIMDLQFKVSAIIFLVQRGGRILIPTGDITIQAGDMLKIFTLAEDAEAVKEMFSK